MSFRIGICACQSVRPRGPGINPISQGLDLRFGQPRHITLFWRHDDFFILAAHITNQGARFGVMRNDSDLATVAAFESVLANIEPITAFLFVWTVAAKATAFKNRENVFRKVRGGKQASWQYEGGR